MAMMTRTNMVPMTMDALTQQSYETPDPDALASLLTEGPAGGDPDSLGNPEPIPEAVPEEPEPTLLDPMQCDALAQLHLQELQSYTDASEAAQWKASDPQTR